ncbi:hypothetical protein NONO_c18520 [Nocardia nova SH22a]|uniref:Uncharacterized protein n=1 Tax=Nocardia nova SH22a TaxID=1415166 RepID=W5TBP7_9NOCA|nr:hypothetical protein [Nocardia nova]AHH16652.1 hypothetical protein NONO_c18520 [Nocardia nova SH22a]
MSDYLGYCHGTDGWKIVGPDGYCWSPEDYRLELESEADGPALGRTTIGIEPEMVQDIGIRREVEG